MVSGRLPTPPLVHAHRNMPEMAAQRSQQSNNQNSTNNMSERVTDIKRLSLSSEAEEYRRRR